jgi:hypothetical protein
VYGPDIDWILDEYEEMRRGTSTTATTSLSLRSSSRSRRTTCSRGVDEVRRGWLPLLELAARERAEISVNVRVAYENVMGACAAAAERLRATLTRDMIPF